MGNLEIKHKSVQELLAYQNNNKKHPPEQIRKIAASIKEFGFRNPVLIDKDNVIIAGHGRVTAAKTLRFDSVPCIVIDDLSPEQIKAFRIMDNKSAESEYDFDALAVEFQSLLESDYNLDFTGFDAEEVKGILGNDPEEVEEVEADDAETIETNIQEGDIFTIGKHRLMCGDSTDYALVKDILMQGLKVDLVVTDPPYNVDYEGGTGLKIKNDNMSDDLFYKFLNKSFSVYDKIMKDGAAIYVFHADMEGINFRKSFKDFFYLSSVCIWVKPSLVLGRSDYHWQHEPVLYGWKKGLSHTWFADRKQTSVWSFEKTKKNSDHPTMKPIDLISYPIKNSSKSGDLIIDLFGGSGSTMVACEQLNRACYMMELDPKYCQVIINRMRKLNPDIQIKCENRDIEV